MYVSLGYLAISNRNKTVAFNVASEPVMLRVLHIDMFLEYLERCYDFIIFDANFLATTLLCFVITPI
jgi:hypothetical protein